jgi:hypothetical protein
MRWPLPRILAAFAVAGFAAAGDALLSGSPHGAVTYGVAVLTGIFIGMALTK